VEEKINNSRLGRNSHRYALSYDEKGKLLFATLLTTKALKTPIQVN